ncbi:MAG: polysaccharide deacetylase family protein [Gammaproteobacteria bacterium]
MNNSLRFIAKSFVHGVIDWSGRSQRQRRRLRGKLIVLTYHSFCTEWSRGLFHSLPVDRFERQILFLRSNFKLVSLQQGLDYLQQGNIDDQPWLAITIDDGFRDNYTHAWPIFQRYDVPVTIFLATDFIDTGRPPWPTQLVEIFDRTKAQIMEAPFRADIKSIAKRSACARYLKKIWCSLPPQERFKRLEELRRHLCVSEETNYPPLTWRRILRRYARGTSFGSQHDLP